MWASGGPSGEGHLKRGPWNSGCCSCTALQAGDHEKTGRRPLPEAIKVTERLLPSQGAGVRVGPLGSASCRPACGAVPTPTSAQPAAQGPPWAVPRWSGHHLLTRRVEAKGVLKLCRLAPLPGPPAAQGTVPSWPPFSCPSQLQKRLHSTPAFCQGQPLFLSPCLQTTREMSLLLGGSPVRAITLRHHSPTPLLPTASHSVRRPVTPPPKASFLQGHLVLVTDTSFKCFRKTIRGWQQVQLESGVGASKAV